MSAYENVTGKPSHLTGGSKNLTFGVFVAQSGTPHVAQADGAFAAAVDERVALVRVELCRRDDLRELLHVGWLDVNNI